MPPPRNNRIHEADFLNRSCAVDAGFESMLLGDPSQNPFSTVSVTTGKAQIEHMFSGLALKADISGAQRHYRLVPIPDLSRCSKLSQLTRSARRRGQAPLPASLDRVPWQS